MMVRTQITLESEMQKQARRRASESGVSLAEYVRRLVERDLGRPRPHSDLTCIFDLGRSRASDIAAKKDSMLAEAFGSSRKRARR